MKSLEGRIAVVTGATVGVARGIASELAQAGARVFITGRSADGAGNAQVTGTQCDPDVMRHSGGVRVAAALALEYRFEDIDGKAPRVLTLADV